MNMPLSVGLIGCGRVAERLYLPALLRLAEARVVAVADPIRGRRDLISSQIPDCVSFSSAKELLRQMRIAAAIITTPPTTHVAMATLALRAGIPVLVEKPLAPSMAEVGSLEALIASSDGSLMMGFNRRHWEPVRRLRQITSNLNDSSLISAQLVMVNNLQNWSPISDTSDPLDDLGSHQLDLLRYIFSCEISAISSSWTDKHAIHMRVKLARGVIADCLAKHGNVYKESIIIRWKHKQYYIHSRSDRIRPSVGRIRSMLDFSDRVKRRLIARQSSLKNSYRLQLISFFDYIQSGATPHPGIADGIAAIRAVEVARQSAAGGGVEVSI